MMAATPSLALDLCKEIDAKYSVNLVESTKFSLINRNQCMILFRKLLDTRETLVTIQHKLSDSKFTSSQSSDVGPVIHGLIHVLKRVHVIFFKDCFCKDKWLETALRQGGDLKETFGEIVSDLQWYRSVLHSVVFKQVGQYLQDLAPVHCDRNLSEIDLEALAAAAKSDQEDLKGFLRELKREPARCGENGGYISMQCLATQLLDKLEFQPWSSTALEKYDEGLHEGGRNKWSEWPLVLSVNMQDLRKGPLLGEGSFGSVHETDWLGETYAMKIPKHGHYTQCLELEIKALAGLQHPHVIRLVGCAEEEGKHLYLMERMDKSLSKMLEDCPLPLVQGVDMMIQIAEGVRYLHSKNIVHRDLKPDNILVKRDDCGPESLMLAAPVEHFWIAKVSDFGCAKEKMESMAYAGQTTNVGTTMFMAPEMYELENGAQQPERFHPMKTDVYSFALICFGVLTSESAPFPFKELMNPTVKAFKDRVRKGKRPELPPNCPVYLSDLIQQCWDGNPVKRPNFDYICKELRHIKDFLLTGRLISPQLQTPDAPNTGIEDSAQPGVEVPPETRRLEWLLVACAEAVGENDFTQASALITKLYHVVSIFGDPMQRLAAYMVEGLVGRMTASGGNIYRKLKCKEPLVGDFLSPMQVLYQVCPYFKFGYMAANGAIAEAFRNEERVHIVDFGINQGVQWHTLIQALAGRPDGPPQLRITGVEDHPTTGAGGGGGGGGLESVGDRLRKLAQSVGVPFVYHALVVKDPTVAAWMLKRQHGEALAVNFVLQLHHMPGESMMNPRDRLLQTVKGLNPKVVTLVEQEANTNTAPFLPRFIEAMNYYLAVFQSLDITLPRESRDRINVEQQCLARDIVNVIACEGAERVERHEVLGKWRSRMTMAGFRPHPLSFAVEHTIKLMLKDYSNNYKLKEEEGALFLGWMNRSLIVASAWH